MEVATMDKVKRVKCDMVGFLAAQYKGVPMIVDHNLYGYNYGLLVSPKLYAAIKKEREVQ